MSDASSIDMSQYVHLSQLERVQAELEVAIQELEASAENSKALEKAQAEHKALLEKYAGLEGKVRQRAHRDAFEKIFDEVKVKKELRDDLYRLSDWKAESDEPDPRKLKEHLEKVLEQRPWAIDAEGEADKKPARKKLEADESGTGRGGSVQSAEGKFKLRASDVQNPDWMKRNQDRYLAASKAGDLQFVD